MNQAPVLNGKTLARRRVKEEHVARRTIGEQKSAPKTEPIGTALLVGVPCVATLFLVLLHGYEGWWYPLATIIHHPETANPAFGYRQLLPMLARAFEHIVPAASDHNAFVATQLVAIVATVFLCGEWTRLFLPRFGRPLGYLLTTVMLAPTLDYWDFYDIAIVGFWAACLWLLYRKEWIGYTTVFALATLNHENNLLLVPVAVLFAASRMRISRLAIFAGAQVALFAAIRYAIIHAVHGARLWDFRLTENLEFWRWYSPRQLVYAAIVLVPWWLLAVRGWRKAPALVRCGGLAWLGLVAVTILFGRFDEARQFDAFIPVAIALIACWLNEETSKRRMSPAFASAGHD